MRGLVGGSLCSPPVPNHPKHKPHPTKHQPQPPTLSLAGRGDRILGHPKDVLSFVEEHGPEHRSRFDFRVLGKGEGHMHDYDHTGMLIHRDAEGDHFPEVLEWVRLHD